ncbi:MAG TPA: DEAD/DEAH box helicase family protein [Candidatus Nosocomiicoccus stercorigallinarum]|nr:DEAD/DEAH box helicase family protein [Candidatus Nosocomiicoccus stercorigallinarum]
MKFTRNIDAKVYAERGVVKDRYKYKCLRCGNYKHTLFCTYTDYYGEVTYCLRCVNLGRSDSRTPLRVIEPSRYRELIEYKLSFQLNNEQQYAQERIVQAIKHRHDLIIYAVTGAGKTEITFRGIQFARSLGMNVLFVSPRVDVIREIYLRLTDAFKDARIDLLYSDEKIEADFVFTVSTVHQLYNFRNHYDVIIVDEVDAFPLTKDQLLKTQIDKAKTDSGVIIYLTATPEASLMRKVKKENIVSITRRYHKEPLVMPKVYYTNIKKSLKKKQLPEIFLKRLRESLAPRNRKIFIFVPNIDLLIPIKEVLNKEFEKVETIFSGDPLRKEKIDRMRRGEIDIMITTTILERGVTFKRLDVFVVHGEYFDDTSLIQIAGRAGRKLEDTKGNVYIFSKYNTRGIMKAREKTFQFNRGKVKL